MSSYATHETTERDDLLFGDDILEVLGRSVEWHFLDGLGRLTGVLVKKENYLGLEWQLSNAKQLNSTF